MLEPVQISVLVHPEDYSIFLFCILYSVRPQGMTSGSSFYQAPCFYREVFNSRFEHKMTGRREKATYCGFTFNWQQIPRREL